MAIPKLSFTRELADNLSKKPNLALVGATGAVGGATGLIEADGESGTSLALRVTRTVSFFKGTLEVCLDGALFSLSLMRLVFHYQEK
jgi:hypothetical protein